MSKKEQRPVQNGLDPAEELRLVAAAQAGDEAALDRLIGGYLGLIRTMARDPRHKVRRGVIDEDDQVGAAVLEVMQVIFGDEEKQRPPFDPAGGADFRPAVIAAIDRSMVRQKRHEMYHDGRVRRRKKADVPPGAPAPEPERVVIVRENGTQPMRTDEARLAAGWEMVASGEDEAAPTIWETVAVADEDTPIMIDEGLLDLLKPDQRFVLVHTFGLFGAAQISQDELVDFLQLSQSRVSRLKAEALAVCRRRGARKFL